VRAEFEISVVLAPAKVTTMTLGCCG